MVVLKTFSPHAMTTESVFFLRAVFCSELMFLLFFFCFGLGSYNVVASVLIFLYGLANIVYKAKHGFSNSVRTNPYEKGLGIEEGGETSQWGD